MKLWKSAFISVTLTASTGATAELIGGVEFPDGTLSFADQVISYNPSAGVLAPHNNPGLSLGVPDFANDNGYVSLGDEGTLVVKFTDNSLTTSGTSNLDLWIFEIGSAIEPTAIAISTNGFDWIEVGSTHGSTHGVDIDAYIGAGVTLGEQYSYVRITDLLPHQSGSPFAGADIDAIGAIASAAPVVPVPAAAWLFGTGLITMIGMARRKQA